MQNDSADLELIIQTCAKASEDSDLTGVGVRFFTFYGQTALSVIFYAFLPEADPADAAWSLIATFWGLFIAALIHWRQNKLTLLQGIIVSRLMLMHACASSLVLAATRNPRGPQTTLRRLSVCLLQAAVLTSLGTTIVFTHVVGIRRYRLGNPACNLVTRGVFLGIKPSKASAGTSAIASFILPFAITWVYAAFCIPIMLVTMLDRQRWFTGTPHQHLGPPIAPISTNLRRQGIYPVLRVQYRVEQLHHLPGIGHAMRLQTVYHLSTEWALVLSAILWSLLVLEIERTIHINQIVSNTWAGFGQVFCPSRRSSSGGSSNLELPA